MSLSESFPLGFLTTPLDSALGSKSKVRLLRLLVEQDRTFSAREAARLTGSSNPAILAAIEDLAKLGLIHREISGRQFLCRANRDHRLVLAALQPLFAAESQWPGRFFEALRVSLKDLDRAGELHARTGRSAVMAAWVFGSVATGKDTPGSDVDLFILVRTESRVQPIMEKLAERLTIWRKEFGADIRPVVMSREEFSAQMRRGNSFLRQAIRDARLIAGEIPRELRLGKANYHTKSR